MGTKLTLASLQEELVRTKNQLYASISRLENRIVEQRLPKLIDARYYCEDCRHFIVDGKPEYAKCSNPDVSSDNLVVRGKGALHCTTARSEYGKCGPKAKLFEAKLSAPRLVFDNRPPPAPWWQIWRS